MSLFNFSGEGVSYNPLRGLVRELREANRRGEEENEEVEGIEAEREITGKGVSRMAGEEMSERMSRTRLPDCFYCIRHLPRAEPPKRFVVIEVHTV